eukprot:4183515-Pyramimonas_sp.AAC.1
MPNSCDTCIRQSRGFDYVASRSVTSLLAISGDAACSQRSEPALESPSAKATVDEVALALAAIARGRRC